MNSPIRTLPPELIAKLSPHRTHESNWFKGLLCNFGLDRWYRLNLGAASGESEVRLCRWCPKVKVRGVVYGD